MPVTFSAQADLLVAYLSGEVDHHAAASIREAVDEMAESTRPKELILDFEKVPFMDSSGIAVVINSVRRMREIGGKLKLQNIPPQPMKVLKAAGIEKITPIHERSESR